MPVNDILVEKICRLICKRKFDDPDLLVSSETPQIHPFGYALYQALPKNSQPIWTIYQKEVRMVLEILENGEFILDKSVEEKHTADQAQGQPRTASQIAASRLAQMQALHSHQNYGIIAGAAKKATP